MDDVNTLPNFPKNLVFIVLKMNLFFLITNQGSLELERHATIIEVKTTKYCP